MGRKVINNWFSKLYIKIQNSTKTKIILMYTCSLIVVYMITWCVLTVYLFQPLELEKQRNVRYNSEKIVKDIRGIVGKYDNILYLLSNDHTINQSLSEECKTYEDVWEALRNIKYCLGEDLDRSSCIKKIEVYQQGSDIGQDGKYVFMDGFNPEKLEKNDWGNETIDNRILLCKYHKVLSLYNNVQAYIKIAISAQEAFEETLIMEREMSGDVLLSDENGYIIASNQPEFRKKNIKQILLEPESLYQEGRIIETNDLLVMKSQVNDKWKVYMMVYSNQLKEQVNHSQIIAGMILLGYGIISGIILSLLLEKVFRRLNYLGKRMEHMKVNMKYITVPNKHDEVTILELQYNSMLDRLEEVINEMAEVKSQKQIFEFKSLESQINPHFLYNTLGVMRWEALESGKNTLVSMIDNLAIFYRLSLNKGKGLLTVDEECCLVLAYIEIQQIRWDYVVDVEIKIEESIKSVVIPKMILQPLVENIWLHGNITAKENRKIAITASEHCNNLELTIWDNGDGIAEDTLHQIIESKSEISENAGIGISFIRNILMHYYGEEFIYEVTSSKQLGTKIRIELPREMGVNK